VQIIQNRKSKKSSNKNHHQGTKYNTIQKSQYSTPGCKETTTKFREKIGTMIVDIKNINTLLQIKI
jgi:hypothetical protein